MINEHEVYAREAKAAKLADAFASLCTHSRAGIEPAEVPGMASAFSEAGRDSLARVIGVRPPSQRTWDRVVQILHLRLRPCDDPFDGLPS